MSTTQVRKEYPVLIIGAKTSGSKSTATPNNDLPTADAPAKAKAKRGKRKSGKKRAQERAARALQAQLHGEDYDVDCEADYVPVGEHWISEPREYIPFNNLFEDINRRPVGHYEDFALRSIDPENYRDNRALIILAFLFVKPCQHRPNAKRVHRDIFEKMVEIGEFFGFSVKEVTGCEADCKPVEKGLKPCRPYEHSIGLHGTNAVVGEWNAVDNPSPKLLDRSIQRHGKPYARLIPLHPSELHRFLVLFLSQQRQLVKVARGLGKPLPPPVRKIPLRPAAFFEMLRCAEKTRAHSRNVEEMVDALSITKAKFKRVAPVTLAAESSEQGAVKGSDDPVEGQATADQRAEDGKAGPSGTVEKVDVATGGPAEKVDGGGEAIVVGQDQGGQSGDDGKAESSGKKERKHKRSSTGEKPLTKKPALSVPLTVDFATIRGVKHEDEDGQSESERELEAGQWTDDE